MHPDPQDASDRSVVHVGQRPQFVTEPDGRVRAYYPGEDWYVTGTDRQDAIALLHAGFDQRMQDPAYVAEHWERTQRHRDGRETTPGFEVTDISTVDYADRTARLGDRLRTTDRPE